MKSMIKAQKTNHMNNNKMPRSTKRKYKELDELEVVIDLVCREEYHRYDKIHSFDDHNFRKANYNALFRENTENIMKQIPSYMYDLEEKQIMKLVENMYKTLRKNFDHEAKKIKHYNAFHYTDYLLDSNEKVEKKKKNKPKKINRIAPLMLPTKLFDEKSNKFEDHEFTREELHSIYEKREHKYKFMNGKGCFADHAIYHKLGDGCRVLDINDDSHKKVEKIVITVNTNLAEDDMKTTEIVISKVSKKKKHTMWRVLKKICITTSQIMILHQIIMILILQTQVEGNLVFPKMSI